MLHIHIHYDCKGKPQNTFNVDLTQFNNHVYYFFKKMDAPLALPATTDHLFRLLFTSKNGFVTIFSV